MKHWNQSLCQKNGRLSWYPFPLNPHCAGGSFSSKTPFKDDCGNSQHFNQLFYINIILTSKISWNFLHLKLLTINTSTRAVLCSEQWPTQFGQNMEKGGESAAALSWDCSAWRWQDPCPCAHKEVGWPSLEVFQTHGDVALTDMEAWWGWAGVGRGDPRGLFQQLRQPTRTHPNSGILISLSQA